MTYLTTILPVPCTRPHDAAQPFDELQIPTQDSFRRQLFDQDRVRRIVHFCSHELVILGIGIARCGHPRRFGLVYPLCGYAQLVDQVGILLRCKARASVEQIA